MASTRSSSPASSRGASPQPLTPRSKIKALLATVDSSDDEGSNQQKKDKREMLAKQQALEMSKLFPNRPSQSDNDDEDSEEEIRPRGRLASRMQGAAAPKPAPQRIETETTTTQPQDAPEAELELPKLNERDNSIVDAGSDAEDELPVAPRRLKRRLQRQSTPDSHNGEDAANSSKPASPGLFVSSPARPSPAKSVTRDSESEHDLPATKSDRFKALVERKRQERLAREAAEEARQAERRAQQEKLASEMEQLDSNDDDVDDITDDEGGRTLTQKARPTRKASRKAIEEMNRETQRMQRSMQLAHEAKTRKRITTASLFERFNYRPAGGMPVEPKTASSSRPGTPQSDVEAMDSETPPTSPPLEDKPDAAKENNVAEVTMEDAEDEELPSVDQILSSSPKVPVDKGKGKAVALDVLDTAKLDTKPKRRQVRVRLPAVSANTVSLDSDDELEIVQSKKDKIDAVFNSIPTKQSNQSHSLQVLKALAHVRSPGKERQARNDRPGMTTGELHNQLQLRARQQAKLEREKRLNMLKAQGVVVETAEERERQMQEVEDIVAKAREEAHKIMEQEREESKGVNGDKTHDPLAWDDSDDEEYHDSANEADAEASAVELSGSEDEKEEEEDEEGEDVDLAPNNALFDDEASDAGSESSDSKASANEEESDMEEKTAIPVQKQRRARKQTAIVSDDEDDVQIEATPRPKNATQKTTPGAPKTDSPVAPGSVLRSAKKTFIPGLPVEGPAGLGLTQIFAGTMDDSEMSAANGPTQSMMPDFDNFPDSSFSATMDDPADEMVVDSQKEETQKSTQAVQLDLAQSQMRGLDSLMRHESNSQLSEMVQFTQDGGFQDYTPLKERFVEPPVSTIDTVVAPSRDEDAHESPLVRRGRLRRKVDMVLPEEESTPVAEVESQTAFSVMKEGAQSEKKKQVIDEFNRKKSKAKEMVEEQAEESEDEYAGLGGADGEDSDNESVASMREMIDDAAGNDLDERKLAAFYADKERAQDEQDVEKLFKDITSGMLRRKRGADYDLSDSDDGGEARRRMKRRQFAKMQKALFQDERVKKIAENPGNEAFLRTIEDRGSDDELDILTMEEAPSQEDSQSPSQSQEQPEGSQKIIADSQPRKPLGDASQTRQPAHMRRTRDGKKPSNLGEIRETLSDLLEDTRGSVIPATDPGSDSEDELNQSPRSDKENQSPNRRRTNVTVIDRISLKRNASSSSSSSSTRLAFAAPASGSSSFKVPSLLRRATANSFTSVASTSKTSAGGPSSAGSGFGDDAKIKKTASKRSAVNAFARENERHAKIHESERRREERKMKGAVKRVGVVGGLLRTGSFE